MFARQIFEEIKKVYKYRSTVVHGHDAKKIWATSFNQTEWGPALAAFEYLRLVIQAQAAQPEYCDPQLIDQNLLLGDASPPAS